MKKSIEIDKLEEVTGGALPIDEEGICSHCHQQKTLRYAINKNKYCSECYTTLKIKNPYFG